MITFTQITNSGLPENAGVSEKLCNILRMARNLDMLRERITENSRCMSARFADYATRCADGEVRSPPTSYSTLNEIAADEASFRTLLDVFKENFHILTGTSFSDAKRAANEAVQS